MMRHMTGSLRAVQTLSRVDPDFAELCDVLYGGQVTPEVVWEDVFTKADTETKPSLRRKALEGVGLGATVVGGALGVKEVAEAAHELGHHGLADRLKATGAKIPKPITNTLKKPKVRLGVVGAMIAGDAAATAVQATAHKKPKGTPVQPVEKMALPPKVTELAHGILHFRAKAPGVAQAVEGAAKPGKAESAGQAVGSMVSTPKRALASAGLAGGGTTAAYQAGKGKQRGQQPLSTDDPMAKNAPDVTWAGEFSKFDDDKRLAFGWASVVEKDGLPVIDRQGDYISPEEMETAAYVYVQKSRVGGDMHRRDHEDKAVHVSDLVESVVFTKEKIAKMGLPASTPIGWWVGYKIHDEGVWEQVKKGGHTGFSIHGRGRRTETTVDDVMKDHR